MSALGLLLPTLLFFISGTAALIYQTGWQRMLVIFAGGDLQSVTLIVTAFMLGLGGGNLVGGRLADRQSTVRNLIAFALIELGIGLWGYGSEWIYHDFLWNYLSPAAHSRLASGILLILLLLPPTFLMGMSLPLLSRALTNTLTEAAGRISLLYGMNTLGAATGAILTAWYMLPTLGIVGSLRVAATMNLVCGLGILPLLILARRATAHSVPPEPATTVNTQAVLPSISRYLLLFALTGFVSLGLEIAWFRVLGVMLKSTAFTFGTLLGIYLAGLGAGALMGSWRVSRSSQPLRSFLWLQATLAVWASLSLALMLYVIHHAPWCKELLGYLDDYEPLDVNTAIAQLLDPALPRNPVFVPPYFLLILNLLIPTLLILPCTFMMGLSFPYLQKAVQTNLAQLGRRTAWLQASNIVGCVAGTLIVGHYLLAWLGSSATIKLLSLLGSLLGFIALWRAAHCIPKVILWAALAVSPLFLLPTAQKFWAQIHGSSPAKSLHVEDETGLATIKTVPHPEWYPGSQIVFVNGIGQSWLPYGGIHSFLGALPALIHPNPKRIAIIGLGSGDTAYSAGARKETEEVVCIEIVSSQLKALRQYNLQHDYAAISALLNEPRFRHVNTDGRRYLSASSKGFDIIEADALRPTSAGSGILYSKEYFELLSRRLNPGGFAVTWAPTARVRNSFLSVFPYAIECGEILIGSRDPIRVQASEIQQRLNQPEVQAHFQRAKIAINDQMAPYVKDNMPIGLIGPDFDRSNMTDINTDLFPRDEFSLSSLWQSKP